MRNMISRTAALLLFSVLLQKVNAEGTKEIMPGQTSSQTNGVSIYINKNGASGPYRDANPSNRIKFTIKDNVNENIYFGVQAHDRYSNVEVPVWYHIVGPGGGQLTGQILAGSGNTGRINNYAQAVAGPRISATVNNAGYTPVAIDPLSNGDYYLEIYTSDDNGATANTSETTLSFFDFTVATPSSSALNPQLGRMHCQAWSFITYDPNTFGISFSPFTAPAQTASFYGLTADSTVAKITFNEGFTPFGVVLYFNKYGTSNTGNFPVDRKSTTQIGSAPVLPGYEIFLNNPDATVYPRSAVPSAPSVIKIYGCTGNYYLSYKTTAAGDVALLLDLNGTTGYQAGTSDRYLFAYDVPAGINTVAWDGKDGLGNTVSSSANVKATLFLRRGRTNLPIYDAELNINGLSVVGISPVNYTPKLFWDDASLITTAPQNTTGAGIDNSIVGQTQNANGLGRAWNGPGSGLAVPAPANGGGNATPGGDAVSTSDDYGNVRALNTWFWTNEVASNEGTYGLPTCDRDGDGISDINDLDDDNDGIADTVEDGVNPTADADNDGIPNYLDRDYGALNDYGVVASMDADNDGIINSYDLDSDNDGIPDLVEAGGVDANGNGTVDYTGTWASNDTDNDGLLDRYDAVEINTNVTGVAIRNLDSDGDGIPNIFDLDSDNDGIPDVVEAGGTDANGDGRIDNFTDTDSDGLSDKVDGDVGNDGTVENGGAAALLLTGTYVSTSDPRPASYPQGIANDDGRDLPNFIDLDSDDDGIADVTEGGGIDANYDGRLDYTGTFASADTDGDGFLDSVDADVNGVINVTKALLATGADTNNDGRPDSYPFDNADGTFRPNPYDADSDDDGIPDLIEAGGIDSNGGGRIDSPYTDANGNGWLDFYDPTASGGINLRTLDVNGAAAGGLVFDFDGDGKPNYLDLDSDNDGIADIIEQGGTDANNDGRIDYTGTYAANDLDNDGFIDVYDPIDNRISGSSPSGKTPLITATGPANATTKLPTSYSAGANIDNAGMINMLDLDADNDGILDTRESGISSGTGTALDGNNDGIVDATYADADGDGWADVVKALPAFVLRNTDGIGKPNYLDIDSDDDGIPDNIEAQLTAAYIAPAGTDADVDGIDDAYDNDDALFAGAANNGLSLTDTDGDGTSDYRDLDSDNDGKTDRLEGWDTNGNGRIDGSEKAYVGTTDTDGDGLLDEYDAIIGSASTLITNVNNNTTPTSYPDVNNPGGNRDWREKQDTDKDGIPDTIDLDDDNDGIPDTVECPNCTTKVFTNGGFEQPVYGDVNYHLTTTVPGWNTTQSDGQMEIWSNGYVGVTPYQGTQLLELNATTAATVYQNFCLNGNGATILWTVRHRGRDGVDVASVGFGSSATSLTAVQTMSDGNSAWGSYSGAYTVLPGVTNLVMGLTAISSFNNVAFAGNLIDDVQITIVQQSVCDSDGDGIPDSLDLDSDNDGIPDLVEAGGIDANGDGTVDFSGTFASNDTNGDGLINTYDATATGGVAIRNLDTDGDGIVNSKDLDSDNDGIPDVVEAGGTDLDNNGKLDTATDTDNDGLSDQVDGDVGNDGSAEGTANALIITSPTGTSGRPTGYPRANADGTGLPNPYDLDSDGDGILDARESGLTGDTNYDGVIKSGDTGWADANGDGWADAIDNIATTTGLPVTNTDGNDEATNRKRADYLDIDADNDGITDNIEGQATTTYKMPLGTDADNDGIDDAYDNNTAVFGGNTGTSTTGNGINPVNTDNTADGADYIDLNSDNDTQTDLREGQGNPNFSISSFTDTDGDGLLDVFDTFDMTTQTSGQQSNVTMSKMGVNGVFTGPSTSGNNNTALPKTSAAAGADRDWRNGAYILPIKLVDFSAVYNNHVTNLSWTATNETRSDRYVVERSIDGRNFQAIASVNARGNGGNYAATDNAVPAVNVVYYRLQMVDASGNVTYSKVIAIKLVTDKMNLSIYPNPVVDMVSISFTSAKAQAVTIKVYNASGAQVVTKAFQAQVGTNTLQLTDWNRLPAGDYMIEVGNSNFKMIEKISHLH